MGCPSDCKSLAPATISVVCLAFDESDIRAQDGGTRCIKTHTFLHGASIAAADLDTSEPITDVERSPTTRFH